MTTTVSPVSAPGKLRSQMHWVVADSILTLVSAIFTAFVVAPIIGPVAFGLAGSAFLLVSFAEAFVAIPIGEALIQRRHYHNRAADTGFAIMLGIGLAGFALLLIAAPLLARFLGEPAVETLVYVQALTCPLLALRGVPEALLARKLRFRALAIRNIAAKMVSVVLSVGLAVWGFGAWSMILGNLGFALTSTILVLLIAPRLPRLRWSAEDARSLFRFASLTMVENVIWVGTARSFAFLLGRFQGIEALGLINIAFRINDALCSVISALTARVALPVLAREAHDRARLVRAFLVGSELSTILSAPVFVGLALISDDVILLVMGSEWAMAGSALAAVSLYSAVNFARILTLPAVKAVGRPAVLVAMQAIGLCYVTGAMIWFRDAGFEGQLMVWVLFGAVYLVLSIAVVRIALQIGVLSQLQALIKPGIAVACMVAATLLVREAVADWALMLRIAVSIAAGTASYLLATLALQRRFLLEIVDGREIRLPRTA